MAKSIDSLLKKKGWSGEEVGKALVASVVHDIKHKGEPDFKPLFTQADFDKMESSLNTDRDYLVYGCYRDIYSSIIDTYNRGQAFYQQFYNGYSRYSNAMLLCQRAENALKQAGNYPLIMTQIQYNRSKREAKERLKGFTESYISLVFHTINYFYKNPDEAPEPIKKALQDATEAPATNKRLLGMYNEVYGQGYYTLPDGRRSDSMELEEWQRTLEELYLKSHSLTINGQPATAEETLEHYRTETMLKTYELFFKGIEGIKEAYKEVTGEDMDGVDEAEETRLLKALEDMLGIGGRWEAERREKAQAPLYPLQALLSHLIERGTDIATEWHYYPEPPEGLTKDTFLEDATDEWYSGVLSGDAEEAKDTLKEFKADYPELYKAVTAYIEEKLPALKGLKPAHLFDDITSWGNLAELDYLDFKGLIDPSEADIVETIANEDTEDTLGNFTKRVRIVWNSIAIVQNPRKSQLDANGDYAEQSYSLLDHFGNIDSLAEEEQRKGELDAFRNVLFIPALRYIYAFNVLMGIVGEIYDIDGMETLQLKTRTFENQLDGFNNLLYMLYAEVYGDAEEKTRKRELLKGLFSPVDVEEIKPTQEAIEAVRAKIADLGYSTTARKQLKDFDRFIAMLCGEGA